jgi:hypothetical protein
VGSTQTFLAVERTKVIHFDEAIHPTDGWENGVHASTVGGMNRRLVVFGAVIAVSGGIVSGCGSTKNTTALPSSSVVSTLPSSGSSTPTAAPSQQRCRGAGIPEPTGKLDVGTTMIADTVRAFYPAVVPAGAQRPPYLTDKEQAFV